MGYFGFQLNPRKTECLCIFRACDDKVLSSLVLDGVALPQMNPVHNLGVLLESWFLLEDPVPGVARRAFAQLRIVCQFIDI